MTLSPGTRWLLTTLFCALTTYAEDGDVADKLVGVWIAPKSVLIEGGQSEDEAEEAALREPANTIVWVFSANHTWSAGMLGQPRVVGGWWRIEGNELVTDVQVGSHREPERTQIVLINDHRLTVALDGVEGHWRRMPKDI